MHVSCVLLLFIYNIMAESAAEAGKQEIVFLIIGHVEWRFLRIGNGNGKHIIIRITDAVERCGSNFRETMCMQPKEKIYSTIVEWNIDFIVKEKAVELVDCNSIRSPFGFTLLRKTIGGIQITGNMYYVKCVTDTHKRGPAVLCKYYWVGAKNSFTKKLP